MDFILKWKWLALPALLTGAGAFYVACLPIFIQGGDTAELVAAAYLRLVAHPPGYPLWVWLLHFVTNLLPFGTVFWRASLACAFFAVASLALLGYPLRKNALPLLLCLPFLALCTPFLQGALLPDVFSLHALFISAIAALFLFTARGNKSRQFLLPFLAALGLAHHQTLVFLLPLALLELWQSRAQRGPRNLSLLGLALGAAGAAFLYASLLLMNPASLFSWASLESPAQLLGHALRLDYGLFRLAPAETGFSPQALWYFLRGSLPEILPPLLISLWSLYRQPALLRDTLLRAWGFCLALSMLFFLAQNISPRGTGAEVLLRFHLMPLMQLIFMCAYILQKASFPPRTRRIGFALAIPFLVYLAGSALPLRALPSDSVVEDYARNFLAEAQARSPSLAIADSDTAYFGLRYLQSVQGQAAEVPVITPALLFHPWFYEKIRQQAPAFRLRNAEYIQANRELDLEPDLIQPNLSNFTLLVPRDFQNPEAYRIAFLGVGRALSAGRGLAFAPAPLPAPGFLPPRSSRYPQAHGKRILFSRYASYHLARGLSLHRQGKNAEALAEWNQALMKVPFAYPALENICRLSGADPRCEAANLERVREDAAGIF